MEEITRQDFEEMEKKMDEQNVRFYDRFVFMAGSQYEEYIKDPKKYIDNLYSLMRKQWEEQKCKQKN